MLPSTQDGYGVSRIYMTLKHSPGIGIGNQGIFSIVNTCRIIIRINLEQIISFVIEVSTSYLRDGFIYIKLGESKAVLLN